MQNISQIVHYSHLKTDKSNVCQSVNYDVLSKAMPVVYTPRNCIFLAYFVSSFSYYFITVSHEPSCASMSNYYKTYISLKYSGYLLNSGNKNL